MVAGYKYSALESDDSSPPLKSAGIVLRLEG